MSFSYTKLFSSITESTVWCESYATRIVWITMLAMADRRGRVWASLPGLTKRSGVTREECEAALVRFMSPDRDSRTKDHDGRRIEMIDGGWRLLNYVKYRQIRDQETRVEYQRDWDRGRRTRPTNPTNPTGPTTNPTNPTKAEAEAEAEAEAVKKPKQGADALPEWVPVEAWQAWVEMRGKLRAPLTYRAKQLAIRALERLRDEGYQPLDVLEQSVMRGWRGLFPVKETGGKPHYNFDSMMAQIKE